LLDGGLSSWTGPLDRLPVRPVPTVFTPAAWPEEAVIGFNDVETWNGTVVDARDSDRFDGTLQLPADPRPGHIPGAVNVPCRANLAPDGRLRPLAEVRQAFAGAGIRNAAAVVSYCGSGVTACHNLLTLEHLGLGRGRLYVGGWSEYASVRMMSGPAQQDR
jgi:thiosulfate/3-mercaptopyruvate sulfurtransferase